MIIATAGHVDHGKTGLIKALTGTNTDRLPEEKARGLSIDLGFAYQTLSNNTTLGFVDVPGHDKFIRNMLAGVAGIDLGLLVVAADDGVMPQTREHFAILDLLGIDRFIVAITKIDRVGDDRILQVAEQVETLLGNASHKAIDIVPLCAPDNNGVDALRDTLHRQAQAVNNRPIDRNFRMAIDRVFSLKGIGLVVTGMVFDGVARIDENLVISSDGSSVRVRGIRSHNAVSDQAQAGERCAINIVGRGVSESSINRGNWLMHSSLHAPTRRIDVDLRVLGSELKSLKHWTPTHLHIGSDHLTARVAVLSGGAIAAGNRGLAQLVVDQDSYVTHGDRFVLRDQSAQRTIGGGQVIDPFSPKRGRARPGRIATLQAMNRPDPCDVLDALAAISATGVSLNTLSVALNLPVSQMKVIIKSLSLRQMGRSPQEWVFSAIQWEKLLNRIEIVIGYFHQSKPELAGSTLKDIQLALKPYVAIDVLEEAIGFMMNEKRLAERGKRFHLLSHIILVSEYDRILWTQVVSFIAPDSGSPLSLHQAAQALGMDKGTLETSLKNAVKVGEMALVAKNRYLPISYLARLGFAAESLAENTTEGLFTVAEFSDYSKTGRNFAIDLLEYFDRLGFTVRTGNNRRVRRPAATVFVLDDESL
ncbi:MAG: selenocysteine-specific elongation factor [Gammaproteobacteria bacterium]